MKSSHTRYKYMNIKYNTMKKIFNFEYMFDKHCSIIPCSFVSVVRCDLLWACSQCCEPQFSLVFIVRCHVYFRIYGYERLPITLSTFLIRSVIPMYLRTICCYFLQFTVWFWQGTFATLVMGMGVGETNLCSIHHPI